MLQITYRYKNEYSLAMSFYAKSISYVNIVFYPSSYKRSTLVIFNIHVISQVANVTQTSALQKNPISCQSSRALGPRHGASSADGLSVGMIKICIFGKNAIVSKHHFLRSMQTHPIRHNKKSQTSILISFFKKRIRVTFYYFFKNTHNFVGLSGSCVYKLYNLVNLYLHLVYIFLIMDQLKQTDVCMQVNKQKQNLTKL